MSNAANGARVLYGFWVSPYMSQVAHVLLEAGLDFRYERVSPYQGSTLSEEHRARNPLSKIPVLRDVDGVVLVESQAICRYLARVYPEARHFYPVEDPVRCARVDAMNDFVTFSVAAPFFTWFAFGAYLTKAWGLELEEEARSFSLGSLLMVKSGLGRLAAASEAAPFLLGEEPFLPDFQLFHTLELSRTFSELFEMPLMNLVRGDAAMEAFHAAMAKRPSSQKILDAQAAELPVSTKELFEEFGKAYSATFDKRVFEQLFGHAV